MAVKNSVFNEFLSTFVDSIKVFGCCLPGVLPVILYGKTLYGRIR